MPTPRVIALAVALAVGTATLPTSAEDLPAEYLLVGAKHEVPASILYAVAQTESGRHLPTGHQPWPWTLNVAGTGYYFDSQAEACKALRLALRKTPLVDVGIAQLNVRWNPGLFGRDGRFADACHGLEPYANLDAAAAILRSHYNAAGHWYTAVGHYHRPAGGEAAGRYAERVSARLNQDISSPFKQPKPITTASASPVVWIKPVAVIWFSSGG